MSSSLITGARVVDPSQGIDAPMDVLVEAGRIVALLKPGAGPGSGSIVDASGLVLAPAFTDLHVHLREPGGEGAETISTGTEAAAFGGYANIFCMPNTSPVIDSPITVRYVRDRAAESCGVRVLPVAAVTRGQTGEELTDFAALKAAGAGALSDDGRPVGSSEIMRRAMEHARVMGMVIFDHAEDLSLTAEGTMHEGEVSLRLGLKGIPRASEAACVQRDCLLSLMTGCRLHICHVSNKDSVEAIRQFKARGAPVTAEVSPHHLTLTDAEVLANGGYNTNAKMKPPLCDESDRQSLIAALEDGTLDCIATDHAPHPSAAKASTFDNAPFGIIGMETAFGVLHTHFVVSGRWSLGFLIEKLAVAPIRVMGGSWISPGTGTLAKGAAADLCLLDVQERYTLDTAHLRSRSRNCPWLGRPLTGRCVATMVAGRWAARDPERCPAREALAAR